MTVSWRSARELSYAVGANRAATPSLRSLNDSNGLTLAEPISATHDIPAAATSQVDGWAVRGAAPWKVRGVILAGSVWSGTPLAAGDAVRIATGAVVPPGTSGILRIEHSTETTDAFSSIRVTPIDGKAPRSEWRPPGDEATAGEVLVEAGAVITPAVVAMAATCGYDQLLAHPRPGCKVLIFGDELATSGVPPTGTVRDSLGPSLPGWLGRLGAEVREVSGPIPDTYAAHLGAVSAASDTDVVITTGGTMHGPADHLHPVLAELGARYEINTVAVRPGYPMLLARVVETPAGETWLVGLPGNPQSAVVALMTLVEPLIAGLLGRPEPKPWQVPLGEAIPGRGDDTHLALARLTREGHAQPVPYAGSAMTRGLINAHGFVVRRPDDSGAEGDLHEFLPFPWLPADLPRTSPRGGEMPGVAATELANI